MSMSVAAQRAGCLLNAPTEVSTDPAAEAGSKSALSTAAVAAGARCRQAIRNRARNVPGDQTPNMAARLTEVKPQRARNQRQRRPSRLGGCRVEEPELRPTASAALRQSSRRALPRLAPFPSVRWFVRLNPQRLRPVVRQVSRWKTRALHRIAAAFGFVAVDEDAVELGELARRARPAADGVDMQHQRVHVVPPGAARKQLGCGRRAEFQQRCNAFALSLRIFVPTVSGHADAACHRNSRGCHADGRDGGRQQSNDRPWLRRRRGRQARRFLPQENLPSPANSNGSVK